MHGQVETFASVLVIEYSVGYIDIQGSKSPRSIRCSRPLGRYNASRAVN